MSASPVNSSDDDTQIVVIGTCISIALLVTSFGLRMVSQWIHNHRFGVSDALLAASLPISLTVCALQLYASGPPISLGHHFTPGNALQFKVEQQVLLAIECIYTFGLALIKMSFLFIYLQIFPGKIYRRIIYFLCFVVTAWAFAILFAAIFQCQPVDALWTLSIRPEANCLPLFNFYIAIWVPNIFTDLSILILPQIQIWRLQIDTRSRIGLAATFAVGIFAVVANVIRFTTFWTLDNDDLQYTLVPLALWTAVELAAGTVCASLITLRPLLVRLIQKTNDLTHRGSDTTPILSTKKTNYQMSKTKPRSSTDRDTNTLVGSTQNLEDDKILVTNDTHIETASRGDSPQVSYRAAIV